MRRTYLDHAATSWPKPVEVGQAMMAYQTECGAAAGRGGYRSAMVANHLVTSVRRKIAAVIGASSPNDIALVSNGTAALNLALSGLLRRGDHVVTSAAEHNSVLRPLEYLKRRAGIEYTLVEVDNQGGVTVEAIAQAMRNNTRMVALTHASNVTGRLQPIPAVADLTRSRGLLFLVDAAQTFGYVPIDVVDLGIDLLAAPGHKGGCGPLGTGLLYARRDVARQLESPWPGGTGTESQQLEGPFDWPSGVEAGNLNMPALAGWNAGLDWLLASSMEDHQTRLLRLQQRLTELLRRSPFGTLIGHHEESQFVAVHSILTNNLSASEWASLLDSAFQIEVRSGLHCAGRLHPCLGSLEEGGTLRFSLGHTSTEDDLTRLEGVIEELKIQFS